MRSAFESLLRYLEWATDAAGMLRSQISDRDLDSLVLTPRYQALLGSCGTLAGADQQRLVNGLVELEITERIQAFAEAEAALEAQIGRWNGREWFVVADSSFYIQNPDKLADVDLHKVLGLPSGEHIRLLFPIVVVDELDGLKEAGKQRAPLAGLPHARPPGRNLGGHVRDPATGGPRLAGRRGTRRSERGDRPGPARPCAPTNP
ncbi:hypothetical protein QQY66_03410 [Streptomyces sp. DG2A-72]|uniref:hypothetical protein n=1 Tax=Streptomyces sp. DG2A-72 TaxID=3051386 RepID=UPI00265C6CE3|nr:hypothetical protein [Streptomyces sp. DG2A-72]MDO0930772.1 hypothetical protein [Streptomyces sp. DG2A-72]